MTRDGVVYGLDEGILACFDLSTGHQRWKRGHYGYGQVLLFENVLFVISEEGDAVFLEVSPSNAQEVARFHAHRRQDLEPSGLQQRPPLSPQRGRGRLLRPGADANGVALAAAGGSCRLAARGRSKRDAAGPHGTPTAGAYSWLLPRLALASSSCL